MVSSITSTHASCVRIWNIDINAFKKQTKKKRKRHMTLPDKLMAINIKITHCVV
jgi:hypothetical protein